MRLKRKAIAEYPFHGIFYTVITKKPEDGDLLGNGGLLDGDLLGGADTDGSLNAKITEKNEGNTETLEETILLETECDIQQASKMFNGGTIMADYNVFFPLKKSSISPVKIGDMFRCPKESYGIGINGRVIGRLSMAKTKQSAITRIVDLLANEGQKIVAKELAKVSYTYRSLNLRDSYGWGVYVDGKLARKGYTASSPGIKKKWYGEEITGYEAVVEYLESKYKPHPGIDLVVVAAMPYGEILQNAEGNVKKKYEVIAVARNEVKALSRKFKNAKFGIISHGKQDNI